VYEVTVWNDAEAQTRKHQSESLSYWTPGQEADDCPYAEIDTGNLI